MIVEELIARIGFKVDDRGLKKAETGVSRFIGRINALGAVLGGGALAVGFQKFIELGSNVEENLNVIGEVFGDTTDLVLNRINQLSGEVGRSEFLLQKFAAQIGAVASGMGLTQEEVAELSTDFAGLAVDLSSFFNVAEGDALNALRAGITGETEPLKKFGIVMSEANLQTFALSQGIKKNVKEMNQQEKTLLRQNFIWEATRKAQGDAARTSEGYANASRRVTDAVKDLATRVSLSLLPAVSRVTDFLADLLEELKGNEERIERFTRLAQIAGGVLLAMGVVALAAFAPVIGAVLLATAKFALLVLIIEDIILTFQGGDTVLRAFIDTMFGVGTTEEIVNSLKETWQDLVMFWDDVVVPNFTAGIKILQEDARSFFDAMRLGFEVVRAAYNDLQKNLETGVPILEELWDGFSKEMEAFGASVFEVVDAAGKLFDIFVKILKLDLSAINDIQEFFGGPRREQRTTTRPVNPQRRAEATAQAEGIFRPVGPTPEAILRERARNQAAASVRGGDVNITVNGEVGEGTTKNLRRVARDAQNRSNRQMRDAAAATAPGG